MATEIPQTPNQKTSKSSVGSILGSVYGPILFTFYCWWAIWSANDYIGYGPAYGWSVGEHAWVFWLLIILTIAVPIFAIRWRKNWLRLIIIAAGLSIFWYVLWAFSLIHDAKQKEDRIQEQNAQQRVLRLQRTANQQKLDEASIIQDCAGLDFSYWEKCVLKTAKTDEDIKVCYEQNSTQAGTKVCYNTQSKLHNSSSRIR